MDKNPYEKCVIYIQVHSGDDVKFYQYVLSQTRYAGLVFLR